jgi:hypothetical protein
MRAMRSMCNRILNFVVFLPLNTYSRALLHFQNCFIYDTYEQLCVDRCITMTHAVVTV